MDKLKAAGSFIFGPLSKNVLRDLGVASEEEKRWMQYNYPPCLNLIYFDLSEVTNPILRIVKLLHASTFIVYAIQATNLVNCVI